MPTRGTSTTELVKDPARVAEFARRLEGEHMRFRAYLKHSVDDSDIDTHFHSAYEEVRQQIDCTQCAKCCESATEVGADDIRRLAKRLGKSEAEFRAAFVGDDDPEEPGVLSLKSPCPLLDGNKCSCYEDRPAVCREFPHLDKPDMRMRLLGVVENASYCPIVFNVYERLRRELSPGR